MMIAKYHLAQNNPAWQSKEARIVSGWHRNAQDELPVISGAIDGVKELQQVTNVVAYFALTRSNPRSFCSSATAFGETPLDHPSLVKSPPKIISMLRRQQFKR